MMTESFAASTVQSGFPILSDAATASGVIGDPSWNLTLFLSHSCHLWFPDSARHETASAGCGFSWTSRDTSVSKTNRTRFRRANESPCVVSAGSSEDGEMRVAMCNVPPYCGRVSARDFSPSKKLLTTSHCHTVRFIGPRCCIFRHRDHARAARFCPQRRDRTGKVDSRTHRDRIIFWHFEGPNRVARAKARLSCQNLPAGSARRSYGGNIASPARA